MLETPAPPRRKSTYTLLVIWGVVASLAALLFAGAAGFYFLRARSLSTALNKTATQAVAVGQEAGVPGPYRLIEGDQELGVMTLYPDQTFANEKGEMRAKYRWVYQPDGLVLRWLKAEAALTNVVGARGVYAGVFISPQKRGLPVRLERVE